MSVSRPCTGSPLTSTCPPVGLVTPASALTSVVFPDPLSPMTTTNSPGSIAIEARLRISFSRICIETSSARSRIAPRSSRRTKRLPSKTRRNGPIPISAPGSDQRPGAR